MMPGRRSNQTVHPPLAMLILSSCRQRSIQTYGDGRPGALRRQLRRAGGGDIQGIPRNVDALVQAIGMTGISKSQELIISQLPACRHVANGRLDQRISRRRGELTLKIEECIDDVLRLIRLLALSTGGY
jgi:hypothetical protein